MFHNFQGVNLNLSKIKLYSYLEVKVGTLPALVIYLYEKYQQMFFGRSHEFKLKRSILFHIQLD